MNKVKEHLEALNELLKDLWIIIELKEKTGEVISPAEIKGYLEDLMLLIGLLSELLEEK